MRYEMKISISLQFLIAILEDMGRDGLGKSGILSSNHDYWYQSFHNV